MFFFISIDNTSQTYSSVRTIVNCLYVTIYINKKKTITRHYETNIICVNEFQLFNIKKIKNIQ